MTRSTQDPQDVPALPEGVASADEPLSLRQAAAALGVAASSLMDRLNQADLGRRRVGNVRMVTWRDIATLAEQGRLPAPTPGAAPNNPRNGWMPAGASAPKRGRKRDESPPTP